MRMGNTIQRVGVNSSWANDFEGASVKETMPVKTGAKIYPASKKSSNGIKALEDLEREMKQEKQKIDRLQQSIEDYDTGWSDDFEDTPVKRAALEKELKASEQSCAELEKEWKAAKQNQPVQEKQWKVAEQNQPVQEKQWKVAEQNCAELEKELVNYPEYYAEKYKNAGRVEKGATGVIGTAIASIPVAVESLVAAAEEAERKGMAADYTAALQAEEIAKNKMNDYVSSFFGFYDLIDPEELARLEQAYQQATEYRKSLETKYEEPVDMNSWGMDLMRESVWLKNSATEGLNGIWKWGADMLIDKAQNAVLLPLTLFGPKAYVAGVAVNHAAENMFEKTAEGKTASDAFMSGAATAAGDLISEKITTQDVPAAENSINTIIATVKKDGINGLQDLAKEAGATVTEEGLLYLKDILTNKVLHNQKSAFNIEDFLASIAGEKLEDFLTRQSELFFEELERAWRTIG